MWLVDFNCRKTQLVSFDQSNNTGAIDVKMDGSVLEEKSYFKMLGLTLFSKFNWGSQIISFTKTAFKKTGTLIFSMKFLSPGVAVYLCKSTRQSCLKHCCHVWAGAPNCYVDAASLKLVSAILYEIFISHQMTSLKKYEKWFLFYLKSSFRSRDIQFFVFLSSPLFLLVSHCFRG